MAAASQIRIVEVGPRDGLQNEPKTLEPIQRIALINRLLESGLTTIEAGSFVSPKWVPQMAGSREVLRGLPERAGVNFPFLVPNLQGMEDAIEAGVREIALFVAASESFSRMNINCSIDESVERALLVADLAHAHGIRVRGYISCVLGCPVQGEVSLGAVVSVAERLMALGCYEISLGDTIGVGIPATARLMVEAVNTVVPIEQLAIHFHDTNGQALANVLECLETGVTVIDSAVGGLGGCPYAPGSSGNLATEDLVHMLEGLGVSTGVDLEKVLDVASFVDDELGIAPRSKLFAVRKSLLCDGN